MHLERRVVDWLVSRAMRQRHDRIRTSLPDLSNRSPFCANTIFNASTGAVHFYPKRQKVLILGAGASRAGAPLDDPDYEVWSCNDLASICVDSEGRFRADRWFELHPQDDVVRWRRRPDFWEWLATMPIPVYQFGRRDAPQSLEFPIERVIATGRDYFACTFAYQIGLALAEGFHTIALWGVDLSSAREATVERATVEWWVGYAQGRGITIEWPPWDWRIRAGNHPFRYGTQEAECEAERALVYDWIRDGYAPTIPRFLLANRPPWTLAEWWRWRVSQS